MLRAIFIFIVVALLSALAIWLADNPGDLTMHWRGYEIRTSFVVGVGVMALAAFLVLLVYRIVSGFIDTPASVAAFLEKRRQQKGFLALSRGMVAVAAGDAPEAKRYAAQAHKLLDAPPLTLLLAAQAAQLEGDEKSATGYFERMLEAPETAFLGLRGLFIQARRAGDREEALAHARRAFELRPQTPWAAQAVFEIEAAEEDWDAALATLDREVSAKVISRDKARRRRAVLLTAKAMTATEAARGQAGEARKAALEKAVALALDAVALDPAFAPTVALAARLCSETGRTRKAIRLIEAAWDAEPHPDLADVWLDMTEGESGYDRAVRARVLAARNPDHIESRILVARGAIGARDWAAAREALAVYAGPDASAMPTQRICELMAEIEEGAFGDRGAARGWLARALHAPQDPQWTGENYRSPRWSPIDPMTGAFDALVWTAPAIALAREEPRPDAFGQESERHVEKAEAPTAPVVSLPERAAPKEPLAFQPPLPDDPGPEDADEAQEGERKW
ncbi:heme biosynthesis HemY N-terminal domain-containing protein [Parvibaculum sp.]|uniref:heme biosynthesis protein HemY n=1 Tax=Parvibaculum sp. TaxID=2024848 RepID=UPI001D411E7C|nr:heme biosynthesis HemY N-terminal domain-containing protein [Parvibaculum sp.]MBX3489653.1 heme biosynthesis protein HemY [Parvibaculum sp.]MCW5726389.1 heme biosynthesis protein HemY [Parvibaculum sp.]